MSRFIEPLEGRLLMSAGPLGAGSIVWPDGQGVIEWQGSPTPVEKGVWIVSLDPMYEYRKGRLIPPKSPTLEDRLAIQAELDGLGLGLQFKSFLGTKTCFTINAPFDQDIPELLAAMGTITNFKSMGPNIIGWGGGGGEGSGEEESNVTPVEDDAVPIVTEPEILDDVEPVVTEPEILDPEPVISVVVEPVVEISPEPAVELHPVFLLSSASEDRMEPTELTGAGTALTDANTTDSDLLEEIAGLLD